MTVQQYAPRRSTTRADKIAGMLVLDRFTNFPVLKSLLGTGSKHDKAPRQEDLLMLWLNARLRVSDPEVLLMLSKLKLSFICPLFPLLAWRSRILIPLLLSLVVLSWWFVETQLNVCSPRLRSK